MAETEEEERDAKHKSNNLTMDDLFNHSTILPSQGDIANMTSVHSTISSSPGDISSVKSERRISLDILAETMNGFNELKIQSTINDSAYYDQEENDAESDPNSNPKVATYTTNENSSHKLLTNREMPAIIQGVIPPVIQTTADGVAINRGALHAVCTVLQKEIVTGATRSTAGVIKDTLLKNWRTQGG